MSATHDALRQRYLEGGFRRVVGWLDPIAAGLVAAVGAEQQREDIAGSVGEIGIHHGKLFILLYLLTRSEERAVAVDLFEEQEQNVDRSGQGDYAVFLRNLARHAQGSDRCVVQQANSTTLASADLVDAAGGRFRLFSVDGGHTPEITRHDLEIASGALVEGGVLVLDDYFNEEWPGVCEGTQDFFRSPAGERLVPFAIGGNKVLFSTDAEAGRRYQDSLASQPIAPRLTRTTMLGRSVLRFGPSHPQSWRARLGSTPLGRVLRRALRR